jgi:plasmid replication initiation protein
LGLLDDEYTAMHNFKKRVLEPSIQQINEHTDITVTYEQHKKGRVISGFSFKLKQKQQAKKVETNRDPDTADLFTKMTDAQRHLFGHKLAHDERVQSDYSKLVGTGSYEDFGRLLADMLADEQHFKTFYPLLVEHGFK